MWKGNDKGIMTKKELCRIALQDWDSLVDFEIGTKFDDLPKLLTDNFINYRVLSNEEIEIMYGTIVVRATKDWKGYCDLNYDEIKVQDLGVFSFNELVAKRGKTQYYSIRLVNTDNGEITLCEVETTKTLKQFEKAYNQIRNKWLKNCVGLPCLMEYLHDELYIKGFSLYEQAKQDLELDF